MVEKQKNTEAPVTVEQSKDIMDDILGELDDQDEDDLKDVNANKNRVAGNVVQNQVDLDLIQDEEIMAFNKNDQLNQKYNVSVGQINKPKAGTGPTTDKKKRSINEIFNQKPEEQEPVQIQTSTPPSVEIMPQVQTDEPMAPKKDAQESAIEKEWKKVREQSLVDKAQVNQQQVPFQSFDHQLHYNEDGTLSFFWFDAHEENYGADLYLFGKVWQPQIKSFVSCAIKIQGMERTVFALPKMKNNKARGSLSEEEELVQQMSM